MAGLTANYINNKMSAEGTTAKTKELILKFFNDATSASVLAGIEPKESPVFDDPEEVYIDQIRDYDIGFTVARRIINKRNALGRFTDLTQLAGISHFAKDKFNNLLNSFAKRVIRISAVRFNFHNGAMINDALNIRKDAATAALWPEWKKGVTSTYSDSQAAYSIKETEGNPLCIQAAFNANGINMAYIRAIGGGRMGTVKEKAVSFNNAATKPSSCTAPPFIRTGLTFTTSADAGNGNSIPRTWKDLEYMRHRFYIILQAPTASWVQTLGSTSLPWIHVPAIACKLAKVAVTRNTAAKLIAENFKSCGVAYNNTTFRATSCGWSSDNFTEMIEQLNGGHGPGGLENRAENVNTVSTFSNLIGCDLRQSRMGARNRTWTAVLSSQLWHDRKRIRRTGNFNKNRDGHVLDVSERCGRNNPNVA